MATLLGAAGACYAPPRPDCAFLCGSDGSCGDGYYCAPDGWCKRDGVAPTLVCEPGSVDAAPADAAVDAPPDAVVDAPVDAAVDAPPDAAPDAGTAMLAIVTASPLAFGAVPQTQTATQPVMVRNGGTVAASALTVSVTGTGFTRVMGATDTCTGQILAPMATCSFEVRFTPAAVGPATGLASAAAAVGGTVSLNLTGTGTAALTAAPAALTLTPDQVGAVTFTNAGAATTAALAVALTGATDFTVDTDACAGVALIAGDACSVGVRFTASGSGTFTGQLAITGNPGGPVMVPITGTAP
ncbi:MAG: choice-of-anchor D domain-containing protein [Kofleriaceae bacterium]